MSLILSLLFNNLFLISTVLSGSGQGSGNYVQCASCHDPHFKNMTNPEAEFLTTIRELGTGLTFGSVRVSVTNHDAPEVNGLFLRRVGGNSDSGLCRTCHDKS